MAQLFVDAATAKKDTLYLGLDISTQSTGYAVLRPSTAAMATPGVSGHSDGGGDDDARCPKKLEFLREVGEANLVEWGYISGNGSDGKKGDEVDVGVIVEETLMRVAARCGRTIGNGEKARSALPSPSPSSESPEHEDSGRGLGVTGATAVGASGGYSMMLSIAQANGSLASACSCPATKHGTYIEYHMCTATAATVYCIKI